MKNALTTGAVLLLSTSIATAGGLDRSGNAYSVLFEDGNYAQLSLGYAAPDVSGQYPLGGPFDGSSTGNMAESFFTAGVALKYGITEDIDLALFINRPFGANANYTSGFYSGLKADWTTNQLAAIAKYQANENVSVYGGLRALQSEAKITIPPNLAGGAEYTATAESDTQYGYILGAAYEMPEIALRVALTYESGVEHDFTTPETVAGTEVLANQMEIELPQSVALDFQSGVAADTLVFGTIRWAEWSVWEVRPDAFAGANAGDRITGLDDDVFTYRIGVGRRINDDLSVFGRITYEEGTGGVANRLSPTDGSTSFGVGGSYDVDNMKFTGGIEYAVLGDGTDSAGVEFEDNTAFSAGLSIGFSF